MPSKAQLEFTLDRALNTAQRGTTESAISEAEQFYMFVTQQRKADAVVPGSMTVLKG